MPSHIYITRPDELGRVLETARRTPPVALDTEAASFHRYVDRIYLIQLSTRSGTAILDPLALKDLSPLGALLSDPTIEKVFHDADYDLRILDRDYGFRSRHLFDTRIAAHLAGEPAVGLQALLEKYCGVRLSKAHQKADWSQRPLSEAMLAYAAADTQHLTKLRDALSARLSTLGRLAWAEEEFERLEDLRWSGGGGIASEGKEGGEGEVPRDGAYLKLKGARTLKPRQLAALRELVRWREERAAAQDRAPFRIIGNEALLAVARALPGTPEALARIPPSDLPDSLANRHGIALLQIVVRVLGLPDSDLPVLERERRPPRDPEFETRLERLKAVRNRVAAESQLEPGVLCGRAILEAVARARPADREALATVPGIRRWQIEVLGDALLAAL